MFGRFALSLFLIISSLSGASIFMSPATLNAGVGQTFSLDVAVDSMVDLYAYQFDLIFDPTIVQAVSITEGGFLLSGGSTFYIPGTIDNINGAIIFSANSLQGSVPGVSGAGILASVVFQAVSVGVTRIDLSSVLMLDSTFSLIDPVVSPGAVEVTIPEPSYVAVIGVVCAFACIRGRKWRFLSKGR